jgi:hypothetical protein
MSWPSKANVLVEKAQPPWVQVRSAASGGTSFSSPVQTLYHVSAPHVGVLASIPWDLSPMELRNNHLPMCTCPILYLFVGYDPAHQQICPSWDHKSHHSVNHIQSPILLNMCIKPLLLIQVIKDIIQICKPSLEEVTGYPIGLVLTRCGMFSGKVKSKSC